MENYYTLPLQPKLLTDGKEHPKKSLKESIADFLHLILTTHLGECKFQPELGCSIWESDFDIVVSQSMLKDKMQNALRDALIKNEKRLSNARVEMKLSQEEIVVQGSGIRIKRKLDIKAGGIIVKTNERFDFYERIYIGPISYD
jgi:phage baseplate assembly protein W